MKKDKTNKELDAAKLKQVKKRKPKFRRSESWRYKRLEESWRRSRGCDSKTRLKVKGWPKSPNVGYRSPRRTRNLHPSGYREVLVRNISNVNKVDPETQAIRIAHKVGTKKRMEILTIARERGIHILNLGVRTEFPEEELVEEEMEKQTENEVEEDER